MFFPGFTPLRAVRRALFRFISNHGYRLGASAIVIGGLCLAAALPSTGARLPEGLHADLERIQPETSVPATQERVQESVVSDTIPALQSNSPSSPFGNMGMPGFPGDSLQRQIRYDSLGNPIVNMPGDSLGRKRVLDSLAAARDSIKIDTTYVVYEDSTARLDQFKHHRDDQPMTPVFTSRHYPLYLDVNSPAYAREVALDSTGRYVTVREKVNGLDVKVPVTMPLDDYVKLRLEEERRNNWRSIVYEYQLHKGGDDLAGLLGSITNISIPVPSNPLLSIFGRNVINLHVTGQVDIRAAFKHTSSDQQSQNFLDASQSAPDFNQDVQIAVNGTIGDKLNINADWNTQRTFEYENQLKIKYTGYDDEIVKSVEAGNVSLSGTPSLIGGSQALFGLKANLQAGPLSVTTLLSQKKGQAKEVTISGGSSERPIEIRPENYSQQYYFVDTVYRSYFERLYSSVIRNIDQTMSANSITDIDVWVTSPAVINTGTLRMPGYAYMGLPPHGDNEKYIAPYTDKPSSPASGPDGTWEDAFWTLLDKSKYKYDPVAGFVALKENYDGQAVAVAYRITGPGQKLVYGDMNTDTSGGHVLIFKLIKPRNLTPSYHPAWELQMKNIYPIGADIKKDGFKFNIIYRPPGATEIDSYGGVSLLQAFKLDRYSSDNSTESPDNIFDFLPGLTIDQQRGDIIFPYLQPFDAATGAGAYFRSKGVTNADTIMLPEIYTTAKTSLGYLQKNTLVMKVVASTAQLSRIPLGAFNIVEGSVQVMLNGTPLTVGEDYQVDYIVGEVTLKSERALAPGANLSIKYEQNDLFQLASKTLMGARATLDLPGDANLGFTIMNLSQASLSDKVRLGEEPTKNTIMGVDGGVKTNLPFLTNMFSYIPFLHAREMSTISFNGEYAYMSPDPNTRKSTVASDNGAAIAYIDDFEGSRRTIPLPVIYSAWQEASPPAFSPLDTTATTALSRSYSKARIHWYNNSTQFGQVNVHDVWPNKSVRTEDQFVSVMFMDYDPEHRGMYNFSPNLDSTLHRSRGSYNDAEKRRANWNGIQKYIAVTTGDLLAQNVNYLELWVRVPTADAADLKHGRLLVDLGRVSEDVIPNGELNSEDIIKTPTNQAGIQTGRVQPGADLGLDMLSDQQEQSTYASFVAANPNDPDVDPGDPSGDDYFYTTAGTDFSHFNGTEKNYELQSTAGRYPDTEDLNNNGSADLTDNYIEYEVPLDSTYIDNQSVSKPNPYLVGGNPATKWYQLRIPLKEGRMVAPGAEGTASIADILHNVQYIRLWMSGFEKPAILSIAEMDLVGNQWAEEIAGDTTVKVSVVNYEDNPSYTIPPGVIREQDRTRPDQVVYGNEQSLNLVVNNLPQGQSRNVVKFSTGRSFDVFNYKTMKMFVHGDNRFTYTAVKHDAEIYLRFGNDKNNYYEYREPVRPDWFEMTIDFAKLTAVKTARDRDTSTHLDSLFHNGPYGIKGKPALTNILYLAIGVENPQSSDKPFLNGEVWVNELRVVDVDDSPGSAYRFDTQFKLSDIGTVSFNYNYRDPNFHLLEERFGSRVTSKSWAVNTNLSLDKYFPQEMNGTTLGLSYSHQENISTPKYLPGTDVLVNAAVADANSFASQHGRASSGPKSPGDSITTVAQTMHTADSYSLGTIRFVLPWKAWYVNETFNKISYRFNYTSASDRNPNVQSLRSWGWNFGISYGNGFTGDFSWQPFKSLFNGVFLLDAYKEWKIYYLPVTNFNMSLDAQRSRTQEINRQTNIPERISKAFSSSKSFGFNYKTTEGGLLTLTGDYGLTISRDLLYLDNDTIGTDFRSIVRTMLVGGRDGGYSQKFSLNSRPKIPNVFNITKYLDLTAGYNVSYEWRNLFQGTDLGKSARWGNNITLTSTLRLKSMTETWFPDSPDQGGVREMAPPPPPVTKDSSKSGVRDTTSRGPGRSIFAPLKAAGKYLIKIPFLQYESVSITFGQQNSMGSSGIIGSTGFLNFWGRMPFTGSDPQNGPSRLYQLGLISDPSGSLTFKPKGKFPFLGWETNPGLRAPNGQLSDQFSQTNSVALRTNRPLWEGASLELNWKVGWSYSSQTTLRTDSFGIPSITSLQTGGRVERSYFSLPNIFLLKYLGGGLESVGKKYDTYKNERPQGVALADAFEEGMESLPWIGRLLGNYVPRANWTIRWDGLQRIGFLGSVFKNLTMDHAYTSSFSRDFRGQPDGTQRTDVERVSYGFAPLIGLTGTPKDLFGGTLSMSAKYGTSTAYDLNLSAQNITETGTQDISFSITYGSHGFALPLFGVNLTNDVDITMTYSRAKNTRVLYDPTLLSAKAEGTPLEGTTRSTMEPRIRYTLSQRVSASVFYRYTSIAPDEGGSTIFGSSSNEAGVDIHISIQ